MSGSLVEIDALSEQMRRIRTDASEDVHCLVENARELTDWRHHWRRHTLAGCAAAAALGYLFVPSRRFSVAARSIETSAYGPAVGISPVAGRGIFSELTSLATRLVIQQGIRSAGKSLMTLLNSSTAGRPEHSGFGNQEHV